MKQHPRASTTPLVPSQSLQRRLNMYALAASTAGVSMLALAQPSEARVVYTKVHEVIRPNGTYDLDLNHDGTVDFVIHQWGLLLTKEALGNAVQGQGAGWAAFASALLRGAWIGPSQRFLRSSFYGEKMVAPRTSTSGRTYVSGPWDNVKNRYLGLRFRIHGETHYGWARLSVQINGKGPGRVVTATLTGYAYETVPKRRLQAGVVEGTAEGIEVSPVSQDPGGFSSSGTAGTLSVDPRASSLGFLALGVEGMKVRRRI